MAALGSGAMPEHAAQRLEAALERQASGGEIQRIDPSTAAGRMALGMMGIAVEVANG